MRNNNRYNIAHYKAYFATHYSHTTYLKIKLSPLREPFSKETIETEWKADSQEAVYGPIIGGTVQDVIVVHIKKWLQYRMMNAPMEPTKSSQQLSGQYILTPSAPKL